MKCPRCNNELCQSTAGDVTVDACKGGCGGIWFDHFELQKFDEPHEAVGEELLSIERSQTTKRDLAARVNCPKCIEPVMMRHFFSVKQEAEVDECPQCGGFWLDSGELAQIRSLYNTEEERREAATEYFDEAFGKRLDAIHAKSEEDLRKVEKIANIFRFICPTYYIPGKQKWGAF